MLKQVKTKISEFSDQSKTNNSVNIKTPKLLFNQITRYYDYSNAQ